MKGGVRDRDVILLAALCVVIVLGLQVAAELFPAFGDAIGRPPTVIVALIVVTAVVLARALWASLRRHGDDSPDGGAAGESP